MHIKQGFTFCYNEEKVPIKELINIEGYFEMRAINSSSLNLMFYEDGTFLYGFFDVDEERRKAGNPSISLYFEEIIYDNNGQISTVFYKSFRWGCYQISGDTIRAQFVNRPVSPSPTWAAWEVWYKVIDRNTIVELYCNPLHYLSDSDWINWNNNKKKRAKTIVPAKFIPLEKIPIPNCWLKEEDWFWCDSGKFRAWHEEHGK